MRAPGKAALAGALFGLVPVGLGAAGLATRQWVKFDQKDYNLFYSKLPSNCTPEIGTDVIKGLEIAGVAAILVGIIVALVLHMLTRNLWVRLVPQIFLFGGSTLILIGLIFFLKLLFECKGLSTASRLTLGYSIILLIVACLLGFITAIYFAFIAWFGSVRQPEERRPNLVVQTVRF